MNVSTSNYKSKNINKLGLKQIKKRTILEETNTNSTNTNNANVGLSNKLKYSSVAITSVNSELTPKKTLVPSNKKSSLKTSSGMPEIQHPNNGNSNFAKKTLIHGGGDENLPSRQEMKIQILNYQNEIKKLKKVFII